ncbi:MAG: bis(5'-nucleosyl)-tetraphosphatase (symmetrical) YqeK [Oscillospiraceae bacterium]|nr:bis(5'-nucleosyl)-tetraphosphatase (symmetrical) YqeK [Oscillospiraceae bacterium]
MSDSMSYIKSVLSEKRFKHSVAVAQMCQQLAEIHSCDTERAYIAGILHDVKKEASHDDLKALVEQSNMFVSDIERENPKLWHAIAGAEFCKSHFNIKDEQILSAIRFHTIGKANMSPLEQIVYLGDLVSYDREFHDVEYYRDLAFKNLDLAMLKALTYIISDIISKQRQLARYSFEAYNYYCNIHEEKEMSKFENKSS